MRKILVILCALTLVLGVLASSAFAAPAIKKDVCHFDADTGLYHKINISENAFQAHLDHGDAAPEDFVPGSVTRPLTAGWDPPSGPPFPYYGSGSVAYGWTFDPDCGPGPLRVVFTLDGAEANHSYLAGAHFVGYGAARVFVNDNTVNGSFGTAGWLVAESGAIDRDGISSGGPLSAADFGILATDVFGDGTATFDLAPGSGAYGIVFTVRVGVEPCSALPGQPQIYGGCPVHYRTGAPFMSYPESIVVP